MRRIASLIGVIGFLAATAALAEGARIPPVDHAATLKECGACHLAYPPQLLPARSWEKLMGDLAEHFGENASLPETTRADITAYLVGHAADAATTKQGKRFLRGIAADATPLRITETPFWQRAHGEIARSQFTSARVKTAANCVACHRNAAEGAFAEEEE
jgi:hypothetical protein